MHSTVDLYFTEIPLYTAWMMLGVIVGIMVAYAFLRTRSRRASAPTITLDVVLVVVVVGWLGARLYHVATNWEYYAARPEEILQPGLGGLAIRGAFVMAFVALAIYALARRISFWHFADATALGLALGQALGWVGALQGGANYGIVSDSQIAIDLPDLYGLIQPRFPIQHIEIAFFALLFVTLLIAAFQYPQKGNLIITYVVLASTAQFALGFARGDATAYLGILRTDQVVDLFLAAFGLGLAFLHARTNEPNAVV
jgi:phosphatidylglycerol:prolipoprotein diacylglycerol transferase